MDNLDRIKEIMQACSRLYNDCPVHHGTVEEDLELILNNIKMIKQELLELWHNANAIVEMQKTVQLIDKNAAYTALKNEEATHLLSFSVEAYGKAARIIDSMPTIKIDPYKMEDQSDG